MAYLLISPEFYSAPEVLLVGHRAIGLWVRLASYHAGWPDDDIHKSLARGARKADIQALLEMELLVEGIDGGWRLGCADLGLWKISKTPTPSSRTARPAIPAEIRAEVMERDEYTCQFCAVTEDLTLDHIIPYSHGGPDTVENLRVLCRRCNSVRGNRVEVDGG